ncbi:peroxidase family protein [Nonomuraea gerenzanensis]|uniref:Catalase n=1 Tax=Nonomuraea gerenzanensis TaxID=93944 RepID=A0A1M4E374_9ACTN|nr:peroxidase family protein [Nonomuraea gerenzanensis]UBU15543.1 catalase [Nonomuraea gerenzanensis]SBO93308.1 Catalase [Nonomuraea gerenzanensis]
MAKQRENLVGEPVPAPRTSSAAERYERYVGGSPERERVIFDKLARDLMRVQLKIKDRAHAPGVDRAFHAKAILGVENATLRFHDDLPEDLRAGFARPGAEYPVVVRLSNASGTRQPDQAPDMRGAALRVQVGPEETHDLLMTNHPVSHARNAREFVVFAQVMAGANSNLRKALALYVELPWALGLKTATRMRRNVMAGSRREVRSLALETYWSRGAILWGEAGPVRYRLRPAPAAPPAPTPPEGDPDYLAHELAARLARQDVVLQLCVQRYEDQRLTPIEDGAAEWPDADVPVVPVATLTIPRQDLDTADARAAAARIDRLAFDPWNTTDAFRPLGNLNRARKAAYEAGSAHRRGHRFVTPTPRRNLVVSALLRGAFGLLNRYVPWHRLPTYLGLLNVESIRQVLRRDNLIDTEVRQAPPEPHPVPPALDESVLVRRTYDGTYNDLSAPAMGALGSPFGRNLPPVHRPDLYDEPNPVVVSRELLHRDVFVPARSLNVLAAAWIQFQVHDWVDHKRFPPGGPSVEVPLPYGMTWTNTPGGTPERVMRFAENEGLRPAGATGPPVLFANAASHWWDGSEVYGGNETVARSLREPDGGASLRLEGGHLVPGPDGIPITGFRDNWWLGLSVMHTLFAREHNEVCRALRAEYPGMDEEAVYHTARLVVSALIAKIHTVEWTPAILATELIDIGLKANWQGPPKNWLTHLGLWLTDAHALTGIPETLPDHHAAPYSLTEDFVTVYRMHPLIPDDYELADHRSGRRLESLGFGDVQGAATEAVMRRTGLANSLYSFGIAHPGAITLRNFPRALQAFERDGEIIDLSVVDLVRTRRRAVPRYNDFRAGLHQPRLRRFEDLTTDPDRLARLKDVYRSVDDIDTMVGLFAENPPERFGFSDTAFRIFILMASRRLQSDRFLTVDFRPEIYTPLGMDWVARNGMTSVILRHCPELAAVLPRSTSAFAPWRPARPEANTGLPRD